MLPTVLKSQTGMVLTREKDAGKKSFAFVVRLIYRIPMDDENQIVA